MAKNVKTPKTTAAVALATLSAAQLTAASAEVLKIKQEAAARPELSASAIGALRADGGAFFEGESALKSFAKLFSAYMATATNPGDHALYVEAARQWRIGYDQTSKNTKAEDLTLSERSQKAFERRIREARSEELLGDDRLVGDIPKSIKPDAQRKAEARAATAKAIETAISSSSLVELGKKASAAKKAEEAAMRASVKALELKTKAEAKGDAEASAKADAELLAKREEARIAHDAAREAQLHVEAKAAKVKADQDKAQAERVKGFRDRLRALVGEANEVTLLAALKVFEAAGVTTAAEKKALMQKNIEAAKAAKDADALAGDAPM